MWFDYRLLLGLKVLDHKDGKDGHDHLLLSLHDVLGQRENARAYLARHGDGVARVLHLGLVRVLALEHLEAHRRRLNGVDEVAYDA